jgi:hypothetical protein
VNTIIYSAFADELEQIKLAQLEKEAFGQLIAQGVKGVAKSLSTGARKIMGGGAKPMGALKSPGTVAASPMAKAAPPKAMSPTMAIGSAPTMAAAPATVPYSAAKMSRPPGVGTEWGRVGMRAQLPAGAAAQHEQAMQQILAKARSKVQGNPWKRSAPATLGQRYQAITPEMQAMLRGPQGRSMYQQQIRHEMLQAGL